MLDIANFQFYSGLTKDFDGEQYAWFDIYQPYQTAKHKAIISFYLANQQTDLADVLRYKNQVECEVLIAIQTEQVTNERLEIADIVLHCQSHEVEIVLNMFERIVADYGFIWIDFQYLLEVFKTSKTLYFYQSHAVGQDSIVHVTKQLFNTLNIASTKTILTCVIVPSDTGFEAISEMDDLMEHSVADKVNFYHAVNLEDKNNFWQSGQRGCWLGILLSS